MAGQPRPVRRATSRMSSAPPPYMGARTNRLAIWLIDWLPNSHSATNGERKNNPRAGAMRRSIRGCTWVSRGLTDVIAAGSFPRPRP
jgi:hypothetical protein